MSDTYLIRVVLNATPIIETKRTLILSKDVYRNIESLSIKIGYAQFA